jgi:hypothetical protein
LPPANELPDLKSVHHLYLGVLEGNLGYRIPLPQVLLGDKSGGQQRETVFALLCWLGVLDLAISPPMLRDQLYATKQHETADALLRYYVRKASLSDLDRDKTDCVLGFLCRHPHQDGTSSFLAQRANQAHQAFATAVPEFQKEIDRILDGMKADVLPAEHAQLLREYDFFYQELIDFRTFDQLMDCGILRRLHDLKKSFGASFYHPQVLAAVGVFNGLFGQRFDDLFLEATRHIKLFAERVQQEGRSILSRVDGEVRVKHLTEVQEEQILDKEYGRAREDFENISSLKKAVDKRHERQATSTQAHSHRQPPASPADSDNGPAAAARQGSQQVTPAYASAQASLEEEKFRQACEQIRSFVRAADPKVCFTVPLPRRNLVLSPAEADAFRSDYAHEDSFRSRYASALVNLVTTKTRVAIELLDFQQKQSAAYLWKPHADSLMYLMSFFERLQEQTKEVIAAAEQRGLAEKAKGLTTALANLHAALESATQSLRSLEPSSR